MGRGVFADDFNGTGGTFLISGTLCTQEDYDAYVAGFGELGDHGDEPMSYEQWSQQEVDDQHQSLVDAVRGVATTLGHGITATSDTARVAHAGFDRDFALLLRAGPVQVGVRGWEHDYVVGAGAGGDNRYEYDTIKDKVAEPDSYAAEQLANGYIAGEFSQRAKELADDVLTFVRLELMDHGFECRYRTSAWTSAVYTNELTFVGEDHPRFSEWQNEVTEGNTLLGLAAWLDHNPSENEPPSERSDLAERIKANLAYFNAKDPMEALVATREGRVALTKQVLEILNDDANYGAVKVRVPLYYPEQENVAYFDAFEISKYSDAQCVFNAEMPADLLATFEPQDVECDHFTLYHIPRGKHTESWFAEQQRQIDQARSRDNIVIVSADEFFAATGIAIPNRLEEELAYGQRPGP